MRYVLIFLLLLTNTVLAGEPDEDLHKKCLYPTVGVAERHTGRKPANGTGVIISSKKQNDGYINQVATVAHVILPQKLEGEVNYQYDIKLPKYKDWSHFEGWTIYSARVLGVDRIRDIALLEFDSKEEMPVATVNFEPKIYVGNDIIAIGCGLKKEPRINKGVINSISTMENKTIRISAPTVKGDSGGPTFHEYECIGLRQSNRAFESNGIHIPIYHMAYSVPMSRFLESPLIKDHLSLEQ